MSMYARFDTSAVRQIWCASIFMNVGDIQGEYGKRALSNHWGVEYLLPGGVHSCPQWVQVCHFHVCVCVSV